MNAHDDRNFLLRPTPDQKARASIITPLVKEIVTGKLSGLTFALEETEIVAKDLSNKIRTQLKSLQYPKYKYIIQVYLDKQCGQGITTATQSVWDEDCDAFVNFRYTNGSIWCQVLVHAVFNY